MRLSSAQIYQQSVSAMLSKQTELAKTQLQLSTGKQILVPSDDPGAATRILNLNHVIDTNTQYQRNADFAETRLALEETVLTDIGNVLQRVRELSVRANNDTLNATDRLTIASEVRVSFDALVQLTNSQDANGEYLFSGYKSDTLPFTDDGTGNVSFDGDQGQKSIQIGSNRQVVVGDSGADIFMRLNDGAGGISSMFDTVNTFLNDLVSNSPSGVTVTQLDNAIDKVLDTRANIGARMNTIDGQRSANESFSIVLQQNKSNLEDLDYAEAISRFEQQILALQASQQSFVKIEGLSLFNYL